MLEKKITFDSFIRGIISVIIILGILYLINYLSSVLLPSMLYSKFIYKFFTTDAKNQLLIKSHL